MNQRLPNIATTLDFCLSSLTARTLPPKCSKNNHPFVKDLRCGICLLYYLICENTMLWPLTMFLPSFFLFFSSF